MGDLAQGNVPEICFDVKVENTGITRDAQIRWQVDRSQSLFYFVPQDFNRVFQMRKVKETDF